MTDRHRRVTVPDRRANPSSPSPTTSRLAPTAPSSPDPPVLAMALPGARVVVVAPGRDVAVMAWVVVVVDGCCTKHAGLGTTSPGSGVRQATSPDAGAEKLVAPRATA